MEYIWGTEELGMTKKYFVKNGKPWYPVMGEFHFSRFRPEFWREEIGKMKAGGIQILASYVFWIHHEEREGQWDFSGCRNLRGFLEICRQEEMPVLLRIGPWSHGECRNGGFPDWLAAKDIGLRSNDPEYLRYVRIFYRKIAEQARGCFLPEGGPVIGLQIENEYGHCGGLKGEAGKEHMLTLRQIAEEEGMKPLFCTATGWGGAVVPEGMVPVMGCYCGAPWTQHTRPLPLNPNYLFTPVRDDQNIGADLAEKAGEELTFDPEQFPYLTAEMGGGLQVTAHRRPFVTAEDILAMAVCRLGSGANLLGYYMYHGGTNPEGRDSTLQESRATGYANDLPAYSYDFQAPLGEYGRVQESFYRLKPLHQMLEQFGGLIAERNPEFPAENAVSPEEEERPRTAFRRKEGEEGGFFFYNFHQRHGKVRRQELRWAGEKMTGGTGCCGVLPWNIDLGGYFLKKTNAWPLCRIEDTFFFHIDEEPEIEWEGPAPEVCVLSEKEAEHSLLWRGKLYTASGCLFEMDGRLWLDSGKEDVIQVYPEGRRFRCRARTAEDGSAAIAELERGEEEARYQVRVSLPEDWDGLDLWMKLDFEGDRAELYREGKLCGDWFYQGKPWEVSLRYQDYCTEYEVRVYPPKPASEVYYEKTPEKDWGLAQVTLEKTWRREFPADFEEI